MTCIAVVKAGLYSEHVTDLTTSNFDKLVMDTSETWLVKFYAPWCGHCKSSAPAFSKAAKRLRGVAKLGVVNCDDHKDIAQRFSVQGFPTIKVFKGEGRKQRRPSDYNSARSSKGFIDHVKYVMPSFVARVKPSGVDAFFGDLPKLPHVFLFTEQSSTSPLYKGMSSRFKGAVAFGEVRKSDAGDLLKRFGVNSFPALLGFPVGKNDRESIVNFNGAMDPESLEKFFSGLSDGNVDQSSDADDSTEKKQEEKVFTQPKAYSGDIVPIVGKKAYEDTCGSRKDGRMCVLSFLSGGATSDGVEVLKPVAQKYLYDNMAFGVMDGDVAEVKLYAEMFGVGPNGGVVIIRARKNKFSVMEGKDNTNDGLVSFLDKVVGGDARWKKISADLPEWEVEEEKASSEEAESESDSESEDMKGSDEGKCGKAPESDDEGSCGAHEDL